MSRNYLLELTAGEWTTNETTSKDKSENRGNRSHCLHAMLSAAPHVADEVPSPELPAWWNSLPAVRWKPHRGAVRGPRGSWRETSMIRELIEIARAAVGADFGKGDCIEIHIPEHDEFEPVEPVVGDLMTAKAFARKWRRAPGASDIRAACQAGKVSASPWVGVVHEDGVFAVALDAAACGQTNSEPSPMEPLF
jgi:hypothetical protein